MDNTCKRTSLVDRVEAGVRCIWGKYWAVIAGSLLSGLAAYGFLLSNKLINWDDLNGLFGTGAHLSSGRWGKLLLQYVFPSFSMPWLWGLIGMAFVTVGACMIVRLFSIRNKTLQFLLGGAIAVFPSQIGIMLYMYVIPGHTLAFLLSIWAVVVFQRGRLRDWLIALLLMVISLSLYQAHVAITASLLLLGLTRAVLRDGERPAKILRDGVMSVLFLIVAMGLYYGITQLLLKIGGAEFSDYANGRIMGVPEMLRRLPRGIFQAYRQFARALLGRVHGLVQTKPSVAVHLLCGAVTALGLLSSLKDIAGRGSRALLLASLALLPLSINCLYLLTPDGVRGLTQYSFIAVYVLAAMVVDVQPADRLRSAQRDVIAVAMAVVLATNIFVANKVYLRMYLDYENTYALFSSVMTQVEMTPGFDADSRLALVGNAEDSEYLEHFDGMYLDGSGAIRNHYSRNWFITYYLGKNVEFATDEEIEALRQDPRVAEMSVYPYYGYVRKIDGIMVVKLGE